MWLIQRILFLVVVIFFASAESFAQSSEREYLSSTYEPVSHDSMAQYYRTIVSEGNGDKTVRMYYISGKLKMQGTYADKDLSVEDGQFSYYYRNGQIESEGYFCKGQKCGIWKRWEWNGQAKADRVYPDPQSIYNNKVTDKPAQFPGGYLELVTFIQENTLYPKEALKKDISGTVKVSFRIDEGGLVRDVAVSESAHYFLDQAALECVWDMPLWTPAERNEQSIGSNFILPVTFAIVNGEGRVRVGN